MEVIHTPPSIVTLDNALVRGVQSLSKVEIDLIHILLSRVQINHEPGYMYEMPKKEMVHLLGLDNSGNAYSIIKDAFLTIQSHVVNLRQGKGFQNVNVISFAEYLEGTNVIRWQFHQKMSAYINNLKGNYTTFELTFFLRLKSMYSKRLYMFLRSYSQGYDIPVKFNDLCDILQVPDSFRNFYGSFAQRVIKPAMNELIYSDRPFFIKTVKVGLKVDTIIFQLAQKETVATLKKGEGDSSIIDSRLNQLNARFVDKPAQHYIEHLCGMYGLSVSQAEIAVIAMGEKGINQALLQYKNAVNKPGARIANKSAYMVTILKGLGVVFAKPSDKTLFDQQQTKAA